MSMATVKYLRRGLTIVLVGGAVFAMSCYSPRQADLPGRYVVQDTWGSSILELRTDGTFSEEAILKSGERKKVSGTWKYDSPSLIREPCLGIRHEGVADRNPDLCGQGVEKYPNGSIYVIVDNGYGLNYRK